MVLKSIFLKNPCVFDFFRSAAVLDLKLFPSTEGEGSLIKEAVSRSQRDRGLRTEIKIWPRLLDLGAYGCVDLDEILPSRPLDVASADPANSLPLRK